MTIQLSKGLSLANSSAGIKLILHIILNAILDTIKLANNVLLCYIIPEFTRCVVPLG